MSACGGRARLPVIRARVIVLSRVTLGADVAVTSVLLDAAKQRFPERARSSSPDRARTSRCSPAIRA